MAKKNADKKDDRKGRKGKGDAGKAGAAKGGAVAGTKLSSKDYDRELKKLHVELVKLQQWVVAKGLKVCIIFEGRDGAGKGGTIKAITERVSPRVFRVIALPAPTEREKSQMYAQRYLPHLPAAGEVVIFDRSWYNRAGVERVMGFCTEEQAREFPEGGADVRAVDGQFRHHPAQVLAGGEPRGADAAAQGARSATAARRGSSRRWTSSPTIAGTTTRRRATRCSPPPIPRGRRGSSRESEDKKRVRLNVISHLLKHVPYKALPAPKVKLPERKVGRYKAVDFPFKYVPEVF